MPDPKKGESEKEFVSRCIPYVMKHENMDDSSHAAAKCHGIYRQKHKEEYLLSFPLVQKTPVEEGKLNLDSCVMLMTDTITRNGTYYPHEEVEKTISMWEGVPITTNHAMDDISKVAGHIEDVHLDGNKLKGRPVLDEDAPSYKIANGYIKSRFAAHDIPNVSVGLWGNGKTESIGEKYAIVVREHEPKHLAIVMGGSCNPAMGCGIGLECENNNVTINSKDYVDNSEQYEKLKILIKIEEEKLKEEK